MRVWVRGLAFLLLALAGCNSSPVRDSFSDLVDGLHAKNSPLRSGKGGPRQVTTAREAAAGFSGAEYMGSGSFVSSNAPTLASVTTPGGGHGFELNLVNAPIAEAAKVVLGDALKVNYVVDPRVTGTVTLQTSSPVSREALSDILESALIVNGAGIVRRGGNYQIVPIGEVPARSPPSGCSAASTQRLRAGSASVSAT
jgi:general secretion pathway protein D